MPPSSRRPSKKRRPSRRTFLLRRLVVLALIVGFAVYAVRTLRSDDAQGPSIASAGTDQVAAVDPSATTALAEAVATTIAAAPRVPTSAEPARVLLVGDSDAGGLSPFLEQALKTDGLAQVTTDYKVSSGFVRPDFFDWPARLSATLPTSGAEIVIAVFGANDGQPFLDMPGKAVGSPEWNAEYSKRIGAAMDLLGADGRTVIWVGVPNARDGALTATLQAQNAVVTAQVAQHPGVAYVDQWRYFSGIDGNFAPLVLNPIDGTYVDTRQDTDGFHLNSTGEKMLAAYVLGAIDTELTKRGAAPTPVAMAADVSKGGKYPVASGDSLTKIAEQVGTTVQAIVAANGWADETHLIYAGMQIQMPGKETLS